MGRDILSEFGPERPSNPSSPLSSGGQMGEKDVMRYAPPVGPVGISNRSVGLGGDNSGNRGSQESRDVYGNGAGGSIYNGVIKTIQGRH